jgi:hypothetical protein
MDSTCERKTGSPDAKAEKSGGSLNGAIEFEASGLRLMEFCQAWFAAEHPTTALKKAAFEAHPSKTG